MSTFNLAKQTLEQFPLHLITEAFTHGMNREQHQAELQHAKLLARKEQEWSDSHEAPYEGNFSDEYPLILPSLGSRLKTGYSDAADAIEGLTVATRHYTWLLPQIAAYINQTVTLVRNGEGKIDAQATFKPWLNNDRHRGIWLICTAAKRGSIVGKQISQEGLPYSALVPLMLMPFKKFRNVKYSEWDLASLKMYVDNKLYEAMSLAASEPLVLTRERLLELRELGLTDAKGNKKNPNSTYKLYHLGNTELGGLPDLAVTMLTQIWVASPQFRHEYQVLDPWNWDNQPQALLDIDIFQPPPKSKSTKTSQFDSLELPWST